MPNEISIVELEQIISDARMADRLDWEIDNRVINNTRIMSGTGTASKRIADNLSHSDAQHINNTCPNRIIPILEEMIEMKKNGM